MQEPKSGGEVRRLVGRALRLEQEQRTSEAIEAYLEAVRLDPEDVSLRIELGQALRAVGRDAEANAVFDDARRLSLRLEPGS
jgi:Flp pilus assembly protein TadD